MISAYGESGTKVELLGSLRPWTHAARVGSAEARRAGQRAVMNTLVTERLILRPWRREDRAPFAELNADPEVMQHFPRPLTRAESDQTADQIEAHFREHGFGPWAVEVRGGPSFVGVVGLKHVDFEAPFTPAVEVLWRLARSAWGHGYATEAAARVLRFAFLELDLHAVVSFTATVNVRSRRVMERLGLQHESASDFDHPKLPPGDRLRRHVFYRLTRDDWAAAP